MRGRVVGRTALVATYAAGAIVGVASATHGTITDSAAAYRAGVLVLLLGLAGLLDTRIRINTARVVEHSTHVGRLAKAERQAFAEMGWKAALLDADQNNRKASAGAEIRSFPSARRSPEMRRDGSAS